MRLNLKTPIEVSKGLGEKSKEIRLGKKWTRKTLAKRSGVPGPTLRLFEDTGKISLESFLKLLNALGRLDEMSALLQPSTIKSIEQLEKQIQLTPKRGTI